MQSLAHYQNLPQANFVAGVYVIGVGPSVGVDVIKVYVCDNAADV